MNSALKISAFKDICAFLLTSLAQISTIKLTIKYVKNADEAHQDLMDKNADIVFMSYDDTLSILLENNYGDIAAILPIHGGILDLCGSLEIENHKNKVGIDTNSGYARALRLYLKHKFLPEEYAQLSWIKAGATNLRCDRLKTGTIDATLLNPPFSYLPGIQRDSGFQALIGEYQGVVLNTQRSRLENPQEQDLIRQFVENYKKVIQRMQAQPQESIQMLADYYQVCHNTATEIYTRLWQANGLNFSFQFQESALATTETIFSRETAISIPADRNWIQAW